MMPGHAPFKLASVSTCIALQEPCKNLLSLFIKGLLKGISCMWVLLSMFWRQKGTHHGVHALWREAAVRQLAYAGQQAVGADSHEWDVQVWSIHILPGWQIFVATCDLHAH